MADGSVGPRCLFNVCDCPRKSYCRHGIDGGRGTRVSLHTCNVSEKSRFQRRLYSLRRLMKSRAKDCTTSSRFGETTHGCSILVSSADAKIRIFWCGWRFRVLSACAERIFAFRNLHRTRCRSIVLGYQRSQSSVLTRASPSCPRCSKRSSR